MTAGGGGNPPEDQTTPGNLASGGSGNGRRQKTIGEFFSLNSRNHQLSFTEEVEPEGQMMALSSPNEIDDQGTNHPRGNLKEEETRNKKAEGHEKNKKAYNIIAETGSKSWNPFTIRDRVPREEDETNNEKGWYMLTLFVSKVDNSKISQSDMTFDNAILLWTKVLGLSPNDLDSICLRLPHRPMFTSMRRILKEELLPNLQLPCMMDTKDKNGETVKIKVESRQLMREMNAPAPFEVRIPEVKGIIPHEVVKHCVGLFAKVDSYKRLQKRTEEKFVASMAENIKSWTNSTRERVCSQTPHVALWVTGNPKNMPSYMPIDQTIRPVHFAGRTKQCARCYLFGHLVNECTNKPKSPSEYRRWLIRRMKRTDQEGNTIPITNDTKEEEKQSIVSNGSELSITRGENPKLDEEKLTKNTNMEGEGDHGEDVIHEEFQDAINQEDEELQGKKIPHNWTDEANSGRGTGIEEGQKTTRTKRKSRSTSTGNKEAGIGNAKKKSRERRSTSNEEGRN